jgi:UDP-glucose 4-epimerase
LGRTSPKNLTHTEHAGTGGLLTKILVTGGVGYIGSHTLIELVAAGYEPIVVDSLANSNIESLKRVETIIGKPIPFHHFDLRERDKLAKLFAEEAFEAVIHFAGLKAVGESVNQPLKYYENNLTSTLVLLDVMQQYGVRQLIFSSSATVYGTPEKLPLTEDSTVGMGITNPYGWTKYMIEQIIAGVCAADTSFTATILRYFNPVGAHESGLIGEDPRGTPNNLLPYVAQVAVGKRPHIMVFGDNYNTPDGTGVRDYIHVVDLARGHVAALQHMQPGVHTYNLGTGYGTSVLALIEAFSLAAGKKLPYQIGPRRPGDIAACYASPIKAERELGWKATYSIEEACADSWRWQSANPNGYEN